MLVLKGVGEEGEGVVLGEWGGGWKRIGIEIGVMGTGSDFSLHS